ncbi:MAG: ribonuclease P protein component [Actinomycetales bacterium]|nr:ribonuclease P protein component [Actinomycetales bacterium]
MLPAAHRMRSSTDFNATTRLGAKGTDGPVVAYVLSGAGTEPVRVGLIVSKAVGNSVQRHRASRRMRGALQPLVGTLPAGARVVLRALPGAAEQPDVAQSVQAAIASAMRRGERSR